MATTDRSAATPSTARTENSPTGEPQSAQAIGAPEDFGVFWEALKLVQDRYVDPSKLGDENLTWGAIRGMVESLGDTGHTVFLTPDQVQAESDQVSGRISGIGRTDVRKRPRMPQGALSCSRPSLYRTRPNQATRYKQLFMSRSEASDSGRLTRSRRTSKYIM